MNPMNPMNYSTVPHMEDQSGRRRLSQGIRDSDGFRQTRNKIKNRVNKAERVKRNIKKWRKVANAVLFTVYLKKFCADLRTHRQLVF